MHCNSADQPAGNAHPARRSGYCRPALADEDAVPRRWWPKSRVTMGGTPAPGDLCWNFLIDVSLEVVEKER